MACGGMTMIYLVAVIVDGLGCLLQVIGLGAPQWSVFKATDDIYSGLFQSCIQVRNPFTGNVQKACGEYGSSKSSELEACEAFGLIGLFAGIAAVALALLNTFLSCCGKNQNKIFPLLSTVASFVAFASILICIIIWAAAIHNSDYYDIGFAFALSLVGGILLALGGVLMIIGSKQAS